MRVSVTTEYRDGLCEDPSCPYAHFNTRVRQTAIYVGNGVDGTPWLCEVHHRTKMESSSFDIIQAPIETAGPPTRKIQRNSRKRELEVAADIGGRRQPGSGNQPFAKGDIRKKGEFRVEHKDCYGLEFKVNRRDLLDKIRSECSRGEQPAVVVTFRDKHTHEQLEAWAMVPYEVWVEKMNGTG